MDQGYVLRRLIRRAIRFGLQIGIPEGRIFEIARVVNQYSDVYPELAKMKKNYKELELEEERFQRTIRQGRESSQGYFRINEGSRVIDGKSVRLYDTGFPLEFTQELAKNGYEVDVKGFESFRNTRKYLQPELLKDSRRPGGS